MHDLAIKIVTLDTGLLHTWNLQFMKYQSDRILGFVDPEVALGLATIPTLVLLVGGNAIAQTLQELGLMSEEVFRGDRLPQLNLDSSLNLDTNLNEHS